MYVGNLAKTYAYCKCLNRSEHFVDFHGTHNYANGGTHRCCRGRIYFHMGGKPTVPYRDRVLMSIKLTSVIILVTVPRPCRFRSHTKLTL